MIVMIVSIVFAVMFLVLAVTFLMGKGDMLIAGYNTASEEERKTIDIKRLRIVMAVLMVVTAVFCTIPGQRRNDDLRFGYGSWRSTRNHQNLRSPNA